jgi:hypothetical protein
LDLTSTSNQHAPSKTALLPNPAIFDVWASMHGTRPRFLSVKKSDEFIEWTN